MFIFIFFRNTFNGINTATEKLPLLKNRKKLTEKIVKSKYIFVKTNGEPLD